MSVKLLEFITRGNLRLSQDVPLQQYATFAFENCCNWFGVPRDTKWPYYIISTQTSFCTRSRWRYYLIGISDKINTLEQRCYCVGHEMYHRVTMAYSPIHNRWWLDEMMASAVAVELLKEYNMSAFADRCVSELLKLPIEISFCELQALKHPRGLPTQQHAAPKGFGAAVTRLAIALRRLVTWEELCLLVTSNSLEDWFAAMPVEQQPFIRKLLSCDPFGNLEDLSDQNAEGYVEFAFALNDLGNDEASMVALRHAVHINPDLALAHLYMGTLLYETKNEEEAIAAWQTALTCDADCPDTYYNLGRTYFLREDYDQSLFHLQQALSIDPEHLGAKYYIEKLKTKSYIK